MLRDQNATATVAVRDIEVAREFYERALGLKPLHAEGSEAILYESGTSGLLVYVSEYAGTNEATAVTWTVGEGVEALVRTLRERGVAFEHYDLPGLTRNGDVHVADGLTTAWFKDPDGNIHALVSR